MKQIKLFVFMILLFMVTTATAQDGIGTTNPNTSAQLDVSSTTKGFLPPRMTYDQRNAIASPAAGLMVYCSDCGPHGQPQYNDGTVWVNMSGGVPLSPYSVGAFYQGGIIAYILQPGDPGHIAGQVHGLIAAPSDQSTGIKWYNGSYVLTGASGFLLGTGNHNTDTIVTVQGAGSYGAQLCADLVLNGYSDWYLPSRHELDKLYINKNLIGGFSTGNYWSSTETASYSALARKFADGGYWDDFKDYTDYVRAIRSF